jgi:hypothetical protein
MILVAVLVVGGGAIAAVQWWQDREPTAQQSPSPTVAPEQALPPPSQPGIEPPADGGWPADWPTFAPDESVTEVTGVIGEQPGQAFQVPAGWDCPSVTVEENFGHYTCGPDGDGTEAGGDVIVRSCPDPCDAERRDQMRTEVDAWGLQWIRDFAFRSWAETTEIDGEERYGVVVVAYYRTAPESRIDRQLIVRVSAPLGQADEIQKIANSIRVAIT